jgi:hypothetical protein
MGLFGRKQFFSTEEAKAFLIDKISLEASLQGKALNEDEKKALNFAADEPSTEWGINWDSVRGADEGEGQGFERQMSNLLRSIYLRDKKSGSDDASKYHAAVDIFTDETNWIRAIAERGLQPKYKIFGISID